MKDEWTYMGVPVRLMSSEDIHDVLNTGAVMNDGTNQPIVGELWERLKTRMDIELIRRRNGWAMR